MTPTREELLERIDSLLKAFEEIDESQGLSPFDARVFTLLQDLVEELESA